MLTGSHSQGLHEWTRTRKSWRCDVRLWVHEQKFCWIKLGPHLHSDHNFSLPTWHRVWHATCLNHGHSISRGRLVIARNICIWIILYDVFFFDARYTTLRLTLRFVFMLFTCRIPLNFILVSWCIVNTKYSLWLHFSYCGIHKTVGMDGHAK